MFELALALALLGAAMLYGAYFEHRADNSRDARLLAGLGGTGLAGGLLSLLL